MKKITLLILFNLFLIMNIQGQEAELNELLMMQNKSAMTESLKELEGEALEKYPSILLQIYDGAKANLKLDKNAQRFETHNVQQIFYVE